MSFVSGLFGSKTGSGFQAQGAPIVNATSQQQANNSNDQAQQALLQQQAFVNAVQNQTPGAVANQQFLANQLNAEAQGQGPNPAQAALNATTGQNVANQAALAAGQRGAGSNVGLIARQVGQQGAGIQQQAVGQSAVLQANQQLAAQNALANLSAGQIGQVQGATTAQNQAAQGEQSNILNSIAQQNNANVSNVASQNSSNASIAQENAKGQQGILGGVLGGVGSAIGLAAKGGMVPNDLQPKSYAYGGVAAPSSNVGKFLNGGSNDSSAMGLNSGVGSLVGAGVGAVVNGIGNLFGGNKSEGYDTLKSSGQLGMGPTAPGSASGIGSFTSGNPDAMGPAYARGGKVPAMVSPGEGILDPTDVKKVAKGEAKPLEIAKRVPGKPKVKGDSLKNDVVPAKLETGGVVIPNSVMQSKDPAKNAQKFVAAILAKQSLKRQKS